MPRFVLPTFVALVVALFAAGCGSKSGGPAINAPVGPGPSGGGPVSMLVDGVAWSCDPLAAGQGAEVTAPGTYSLQVVRLSGSIVRTFGLGLTNIRGTGTYPLGVNGTSVGGTIFMAVVPNGASIAEGWWSPLSGDAGSVTITTLTSTRIAGTFQCDVDTMSLTEQPLRHHLTSGTFDMPIVPNSVGPLPDEAGSVLSATMDGRAWNGANVIGETTGPAPAFAGVVANSLRGMLTVGFSSMTGPGTYRVSPAWGDASVTYVENGTGRAWGGLTTADSGSVTVTSYSPTRMRGTFNARLAPRPGTSDTLSIVSGSFDVALVLRTANASARPTPRNMRVTQAFAASR